MYIQTSLLSAQFINGIGTRRVFRGEPKSWCFALFFLLLVLLLVPRPSLTECGVLWSFSVVQTLEVDGPASVSLVSFLTVQKQESS